MKKGYWFQKKSDGSKPLKEKYNLNRQQVN